MTQCQTTCGRTDGCDERLKLFIVAEGQYRAADGSNGRRKGKPHPLLVFLSHTKAVLKDGIHDPTNTKGGFYHRGYNVNHCVCVWGGGMYAGVQDFHRTVVSVLVTLRSGGLAHHGWSSGIS